MILLSRLFKSHYVTPQVEAEKVIKLQPIVFQQSLIDESPELLREKANQEAENLLSNAKIQSEVMIHEAEQRLDLVNKQINELQIAWETERERLSDEVKAEAFQVGFQEGEAAAVEQYSAVIKEARHIVEQAKLDYVSQVELSEETILKLGIKIAEKIIRVHLDESKDDFVQLVKHAIKEVKDYTDINIMVHPSMYEMVLAQKDELKALFNGDKSLYIYPNEELRETGCLIESSFGRIDASIDSQLNELKVKLLELIEEE
jgi:flagellar assembly protein FliH